MPTDDEETSASRRRRDVALEAGVSAKVVSDRIGHANFGFFLQTYAHVLGNDDRDAAERVASFLIGDGSDSGEDATAEDDEPA